MDEKRKVLSTLFFFLLKGSN